MPIEHADRLAAAKLSLDGLSVGDAFGQCFFAMDLIDPGRAARKLPPSPPWRHTDDTEMAVVLVEAVARDGHVDQDRLAQGLAERYMRDPERGYGGGAREILLSIYIGRPWQEASRNAFRGTGSMGNGSAMRVAPLGAYFADDLPTLVEQARLSAEVTHSHPEAIAGATAVALAAAFAWNHRGQHSPLLIREFLEWVWENTPESETRDGIARAIELPRSSEVRAAVRRLGNGSNIVCPDTVPFCLWCASRHFDNYTEALWTAVSARGDIDTNCAIVGGIVSLSTPAPAVPPEWLNARGPIGLGV